MANRPTDIRKGLEAELGRLQDRFDVLGDKGTEEMKASLQARIDEVTAALGPKATGQAGPAASEAEPGASG